ncbi:hypothetical protein OPIT5_07905 [Opitutaceae bacterium TAV5]|nr:hypothetical protein OPIT5_07905 [Opitutaceae bacterium TAV5]
MPARALPRFSRLVLLATAVLALARGVSGLHAVMLPFPLEREITDIFGRTVQARIIAVTDKTLTIERVSVFGSGPGGAQNRHDLIIDNLSDADRQFAAGLLRDTLARIAAAEAEAARNPPDTPWLAEVRRDFQVYDRDAGRLVPLPADWGKGRHWFVVMVFSSTPTEVVTNLKRYLERYTPADAPLLLCFSKSSTRELEEAAASLPEGVITLSAAATAEACKAVEKTGSDFQRDWFDDALKKKRSGNEGLGYDPSTKDLEILYRRMLARLPAYWPRPPAVTGLSSANKYYNDIHLNAFIIHRSGRPARFRELPAHSQLEHLVRILAEHSDELETG